MTAGTTSANSAETTIPFRSRRPAIRVMRLPSATPLPRPRSHARSAAIGTYLKGKFLASVIKMTCYSLLTYLLIYLLPCRSAGATLRVRASRRFGSWLATGVIRWPFHLKPLTPARHRHRHRLAATAASPARRSPPSPDCSLQRRHLAFRPASPARPPKRRDGRSPRPSCAGPALPFAATPM